jgi:tetratricopeptide (TPR) repeat protein
LSAIRGGAAAALDSVEKTNFDLTIPPVFDALAALSRTLARAGHTQDALDRIDAALAREDALPAARALRGEILAIAGRNEEALVETARARKLASGDAADAIVLTLSARTARLTGHATEALAFARAASDAAPDSVDVVTELALAELATGATSAARYVLNAALDNDPHNARLARTYAEVLLATPDTPAPDLRRAGRRARLFGDDQAAVLVHGRCLLAAGEVAQARDALQRARSLVGPDSARAAYYAGLALEKLGTTEEAAEAFAEAVAAGGFAELADATRRRDRLQRSGT